MNQEYSDYLQSEAWQQKRQQRLAIGHFRCAACPSKQNLEVHHLTYARIFNENMADLLPLCDRHHELAERLASNGKLCKTDDPRFLATETVRLITIAEREKPAQEPQIQRRGIRKKGPIRNAFQYDLMQTPWFVEALKIPHRSKFKKLVKWTLKGHPRKTRMLANAFTLYDRNH